jgi:hypothetical protein
MGGKIMAAKEWTFGRYLGEMRLRGYYPNTTRVDYPEELVGSIVDVRRRDGATKEVRITACVGEDAKENYSIVWADFEDVDAYSPFPPNPPGAEYDGYGEGQPPVVDGLPCASCGAVVPAKVLSDWLVRRIANG